MAIIEWLWHALNGMLMTSYTCMCCCKARQRAYLAIKVCVNRGIVKAIKLISRETEREREKRATMNEFDYHVNGDGAFCYGGHKNQCLCLENMLMCNVSIPSSFCSSSLTYSLLFTFSLLHRTVALCYQYHWLLCIWRADFNSRGNEVGSTTVLWFGFGMLH